MEIEPKNYCLDDLIAECDLDKAIADTKADIAAGRFKIMTVAEHIAELEKLIAIGKHQENI